MFLIMTNCFPKILSEQSDYIIVSAARQCETREYEN